MDAVPPPVVVLPATGNYLPHPRVVGELVRHHIEPYAGHGQDDTVTQPQRGVKLINQPTEVGDSWSLGRRPAGLVDVQDDPVSLKGLDIKDARGRFIE